MQLTTPAASLASLALLVGCSGGERPASARDASLDAPSEPADAPVDAPTRVLLFTRTTGYRHAAIEPAVAALRRAGAARGWSVDHTEDPARFTPDGLSAYRAVVFLLTSGDVLDDAGQRALEGYIASGRGFAGVHSASDTEYDWPWYGELVGAYFLRHPAGTPRATVAVEDPAHAATAHLAARWTLDDEWYTFRSNAGERPFAHVLLSLDEESLGAAPEFRTGDHPVAWYRHVGGGRSFYTALGHAEALWGDPSLVDHVAGGVAWAAGLAHPRVVLDEFDGVDEPGAWDPHATPFAFDYRVGRDGLRVTDAGGANQHLTRRGLRVDPTRAWSLDARFTVHRSSARGGDGINSFCLNFNVQGEAGSRDDLAHLYAHAMNLDIADDGASAVMKFMGFVDGGFRQIEGGEVRTRCCTFDREYGLRVEVNRRLDGRPAPSWVTVTLTEGRRTHERFEVDYGRFPWQPDRSSPVRVGANTHGADWTMRDLRVRYLD